MTGRKITPSHLYLFTRIGAAWPRLVPFLVSLGRKPPASDYKVQILAAGQCACMLHCFTCVRLFATLWAIACQAPLSMGFSKQDYWNGLLCSPSGDLPDPGIEAVFLKSPALVWRFFTTSATREALHLNIQQQLYFWCQVLILHSIPTVSLSKISITSPLPLL